MFIKQTKNPTIAQKNIKRKLLNLSPELKDMAIFLYYEKCKSKHSISFFSWFEKYRPKAKELVTKYLERLKEQLTKENEHLDEIPSE